MRGRRRQRWTSCNDINVCDVIDLFSRSSQESELSVRGLHTQHLEANVEKLIEPLDRELIAVREEVRQTLFPLLFAEIVTEYEGKKRTENCWNKFADAFKNLKNCVAEKLYPSWITTLPDNTETNE